MFDVGDDVAIAAVSREEGFGTTMAALPLAVNFDDGGDDDDDDDPSQDPMPYRLGGDEEEDDDEATKGGGSGVALST